MPYRNKTYVCFDADNDIHWYRLMQAWKENENIDFNFYNAHTMNHIRRDSSEETIKRKLRERLKNTKQMIVLIGEHTRYLYTYVRWEMEVAIEKDIPIIAVNLNGKKRLDKELCPPIIRDRYVVHIPFGMRIIKHALTYFPSSYLKRTTEEPRRYAQKVYDSLGID